jgi:alkyldihydroxyacetonephosphate synthase
VVESIRAITPGGDVWESRRLPGSGAGPSPDRMLLGSEGTLAVITEAWVRILPRPEQRRAATVTFASFADGCEAVRAILQSGLRPANARLIEGRRGEAHARRRRHPPPPRLGVRVRRAAGRRAVRPGVPAGARARRRGPGGARRRQRAWRDAFLKAPYLRDTLVAMGVLSETFETAITWDLLPGFVERVRGAAEVALHEVCGAGQVTCRLTHAYADGAAPYFTVVAPARRGDEVAQWAVVKRAASEAILREGGTITHHHAVGRDHRPWYDHQRPDPFAAALRAAKGAVDPSGILNPGVLFEAR